MTEPESSRHETDQSNIDFPTATLTNHNALQKTTSTNNLADNDSTNIVASTIHIDEMYEIIDERDREIDKLKASLAETQIEYEKIRLVLEQKENTIQLQKRELDLLEKEKTTINRDYERSQKEKEMAVVRQAVAEKNIIDLKASNDQLMRRTKDAHKELEALSARLKFVTNERDRSTKEQRKTANECECLRNDLNALEMKNKWNQVKLKQEMATKSALEQRIGELTQQVTQLNDDRRQSIDTARNEEKESEAQLILLKHTCDQKEKENVALQTKANQLKLALQEITIKYDGMAKEHATATEANRNNGSQLERALESNAVQAAQIEAISCRLSDAETKVKDSEILASNDRKKLTDLQQLCERYSEQLIEADKIRARESSQLSFIQELTEKSVALENRNVLGTAKCQALVLESKKLKEIYENNKDYVVRLEAELAQLKIERTEEANNQRAILTEQIGIGKKMENDLENAIGDLEATKRKHVQVVKELNREISILRQQINPKPRANCENGCEKEEVKEPSKKSLIDRIVRLQYSLARQREKNEFLENHCAGLMKELKGKS